jgi:predicted secreted hydrolase
MMRLASVLLWLFAAAAGWREVAPGYKYSFPRDHFQHAEFRTEWWYYTGNLWTNEGRRFGFELVFFRQDETPALPSSGSPWEIRDLYLAHAAITDIQARQFYSFERLNRAGPGIAGANMAAHRIWNGNWSVDWDGDRQKLSALTESFRLSLAATPETRIIVHGANGVTLSSADTGAHYISFPRLSVSGSIEVAGRNWDVHGQGWMDHEWFTHSLSPGQIGWDWFSIQLEDRSNVMLFQIRRGDGSADTYSSGTYIAADGTTKHLSRAEFKLTPVRWWKKYPVTWSIDLPGLGLHLRANAMLDSQELHTKRGGPSYWEGAVDYTGSMKGVGYLEMTGYAGPVGVE